MQFLRLKLSNWRNFSEVDISLASRMFLVGPNASGKSNLLDVFRFLRDIVKAGGGLKKAVIDRGGVSSLRCLAARRYSDIKVEVHAGEPSEPEDSPPWRYRIEFNQDNRKNPIIKREQLWKKEDEIVNRPNEDDMKDPQRLTQTYLEQVNMNQPFRDLVHFFESVQYLHLVPHIIREPERFMGKSGDPFGGDFLERLVSTPEKTRGARLRKIKEALCIAVPQFKELNLDRDIRGTPHLKALYEHWHPQGAWQNEKLFSDGTLRLLGFLWSLLDGEGPLLLEEPELSLHPGVVRLLARLIARIRRKKRRQVLISTHSSDLVADKGIGGDEVLVLNTTSEGTVAKVGKDVREICVLLESGMSVSEAVLPRTEPKNVQQLELFEG